MENKSENKFLLPIALILIGFVTGILLVLNLKNNFTVSIVLLFFPILATVIGFNLMLNKNRKKQ